MRSISDDLTDVLILPTQGFGFDGKGVAYRKPFRYRRLRCVFLIGSAHAAGVNVIQADALAAIENWMFLVRNHIISLSNIIYLIYSFPPSLSVCPFALF